MIFTKRSDSVLMSEPRAAVSVIGDKNVYSREMRKKHIDNVQPATVNEHFQLLLESNDLMNPDLKDLTPDDLPDWYDKVLFEGGQKYYQRNMLAISMCNLIGLMVVFSLPETLKVLVFTKQASTACAAFKRYAQTYIHIFNIYTCDPHDVNSKFYKSLNVIRWKHMISARRSQTAGAGAIYQRDMAITQYAFVGYALMEPNTFGLSGTPEENKALYHFWRVVGYMLGISDRFNVCRKTVAETRELCQRVANEIILNCLQTAPPEFYHMVSTVINGLWIIDITINKDASLALAYRISGGEYKKLGWYSWLNRKYYDILLALCLVPYIGAVIRTYYNYLIRFMVWFVEKWPLLAWVTFGRENSQIIMYPKYK